MTFPLSQMKKNQYAHQDLIHNQQMLPTPHPHLDPHHGLQGLDREDQAEEAPEVEEEEEAAINFLIDKTLAPNSSWPEAKYTPTGSKKVAGYLIMLWRSLLRDIKYQLKLNLILMAAKLTCLFISAVIMVIFFISFIYTLCKVCSPAQVFLDNFFQALRAYIYMYMKET